MIREDKKVRVSDFIDPNHYRSEDGIGLIMGMRP